MSLDPFGASIFNVLTPNFLFFHNKCTTLRFDKVDTPEEDVDYPSREVDLDNRITIIKYVEGNKYSDLNKFKCFKFLSDRNIYEFKYLGVPTTIKINGIRYWFAPCAEFFTVHIFDGKKVECPNQIFSSNQSLFIYLNSELIKDWDRDKWINFVNNSTLVKAEVEDEKEDFILSSFRTVDLKITPRKIEYVKVYDDSIDRTFIRSDDIIASFIRQLREYLGDYTIFHEISDLFEMKQKRKLLFYNARLPEIGDTSGTVIQNPYYGMMRQVNIGISWEFLTDDFEQYLYFRDTALLNTNLFRFTSFKLTDSRGMPWSYGVDWTTDVGNEIERAPQTPLLEDTALFSVKFESMINGWIVEKYNDNVKTILYPITRFYVDDWKFVGALFDRKDPNIYNSFVLVFDNNYRLEITGDRDYPLDWSYASLTFTGPDEQLLLSKQVYPPNGEWNYFDKERLHLILDKPIEPLNMEHGNLYTINSKAKQVIKDELNYGIYIKNYSSNCIDFDIRKFLYDNNKKLVYSGPDWK